MKRLLPISAAVFCLAPLIFAGCIQQATVKGPEAAIVTSCVTCHTDKDKLREVASPEPAEEKSEVTSGEG